MFNPFPPSFGFWGAPSFYAGPPCPSQFCQPFGFLIAAYPPPKPSTSTKGGSTVSPGSTEESTADNETTQGSNFRNQSHSNTDISSCDWANSEPLKRNVVGSNKALELFSLENSTNF